MESAAGGMFVRARASLGGSAFGVQVLNLPPYSGNTYPEHDHNSDDQEEIYLLLDGSGHIALPGGQVELAQDKMIRVGPDNQAPVARWAQRRSCAGDRGYACNAVLTDAWNRTRLRGQLH